MRSFRADPAGSFRSTTKIHPALTSLADQICGTLARLVAYVITVALLAIVGIAAWQRLPDAAFETLATPGDNPPPTQDWVASADNPRLRGALR